MALKAMNNCDRLRPTRPLLAAFSDDRDKLDLSRTIADAFLLLSIRAQLERLDAISPALVDEGLEWCRGRIEEAGTMFHMRVSPDPLARKIEALTGIDRALCEVAFTPSRAALVSDELRKFSAHVAQRRRRA